MKKSLNSTRKLVLSGLFVLMGLILPYVTAHAFGVPGTVLLPMHFSVLLCGLICGPKLGLLCGMLTPVLSSLLTGMPPVYPMLPIMFFELAVYGLCAGLLYKKIKLNLYASLLGAMVAGRIAYTAVFTVMFSISNGTLKVLNAFAAAGAGIVGIVLQIVLIPLVVMAIEHFSSNTGSLVDKATKQIEQGKYSCILIQHGKQVYNADGRGVSPLLQVYSSSPQLMKNAVLVDKIIGKAAAMVAVAGGVSTVYGLIVSDSAKEYLEKNNIRVSFGRCVTIISNRTGTGICPIENCVLEIDDYQQGIEAIKQKIQELMTTTPQSVIYTKENF